MHIKGLSENNSEAELLRASEHLFSLEGGARHRASLLRSPSAPDREANRVDLYFTTVKTAGAFATWSRGLAEHLRSFEGRLLLEPLKAPLSSLTSLSTNPWDTRLNSVKGTHRRG